MKHLMCLMALLICANVWAQGIQEGNHLVCEGGFPHQKDDFKPSSENVTVKRDEDGNLGVHLGLQVKGTLPGDQRVNLHVIAKLFDSVESNQRKAGLNIEVFNQSDRLQILKIASLQTREPKLAPNLEFRPILEDHPQYVTNLMVPVRLKENTYTFQIKCMLLDRF